MPVNETFNTHDHYLITWEKRDPLGNVYESGEVGAAKAWCDDTKFGGRNALGRAKKDAGIDKKARTSFSDGPGDQNRKLEDGTLFSMYVHRNASEALLLTLGNLLPQAPKGKITAALTEWMAMLSSSQNVTVPKQTSKSPKPVTSKAETMNAAYDAGANRVIAGEDFQEVVSDLFDAFGTETRSDIMKELQKRIDDINDMFS